MIVSAAFRGKRYAVFGLARSGLAAVRALVASGADVIAWDDNEAARQAAGGAELVDLGAADLKSLRLDALVVSPGMPLNIHPLAAAALSAGVHVISHIDLFSPHPTPPPPHMDGGIPASQPTPTTPAPA